VSGLVSGPLTQVCLAPGTVDGPLFARLIEDLWFEPVRLKTSRLRGDGVRFDARARERLAGMRTLDWARVFGDDGEEFALAGYAGYPIEQLLWEGAESDGIVEAVLELPGFSAAFRGDAEDVRWQSETSLEAYESAGRSHLGLPKVEGGFFPGQEYSIDVSGNVGRRTAYEGIFLWAAARMWFGPPAFEHLSRDRLLELPVGSVSERGGTVVVDLFPLDWMESRLEEVRDRQRAFRDWMGLDALEAGLAGPQ
jgi:hypothetical protein